MRQVRDLFICEGMYGEPEKKDKAKEHKHMTFLEAADMAKRAQVKRCGLPITVRHWCIRRNYWAACAKYFRILCGKGRMDQDLAFEEE